MKRPLAAFGMAFLLALLGAAYLPPVALLLPAAAFALAAAGALLRRRSPMRWLTLLAAELLALLLFGMQYQGRIAPALAYAGQEHTVRAVVRQTGQSYIPGMLRAELWVYALEEEPVSFGVSCAVFPEAERGSEVQVRLALSALEQDRQTSYADGIYLQADYLDGFSELGRSPRLRDRLGRLQAALAGLLRATLPKEQAGLAAAMLVGDRSGLESADRALFRKAGISHLLVISGLHLSLLCGVFWVSKLRQRPTHFRLRAAASIGFVLFLMAITGASPSVCRAGIALILYYGGRMLLFPPDSLTAIGAAALLLGAQNCYAVCDIGLQLSFAATLGVLLSGSIGKWQKERLAPRGRWAKWGFSALQTLQTAFFSSLGILPVLLLQGLSVSGVSVLANLLTVWLVKPILLCGYGLLLLQGLLPLPLLTPLAAWVVDALLRLLRALTGFCAALPFARVALPVAYTLLLLAVLALLGWAGWRSGHLRWMAGSMAACVAVYAGCSLWLQRDLVQVTLVGSSTHPCVVLRQNGASAVILRGGVSDQSAVAEYLEEQATGPLAWAIDLREEPGELTLPTAQSLTVAELAEPQTLALFPQVQISLLHDGTRGGNLAVVQIAEWQLAVSAGSVELYEPARVDLFAAGGTLPQNLDCAAILTKSRKLEWLERCSGSQIWYGTEAPGVTIRPGRSVQYCEVRLDG